MVHCHAALVSQEKGKEKGEGRTEKSFVSLNETTGLSILLSLFSFPSLKTLSQRDGEWR
jgi:hypothetical protein